MGPYEIIRISIQIFFLILNLPFFFWLIKRLSDHRISIFEKKIDRNENEQEIRIFLQNQREEKIDKPLSFELRASAEGWKKDAVSIVHGPPVAGQNGNRPNIIFEKLRQWGIYDIIFDGGIRPLATILVICRVNKGTEVYIQNVRIGNDKISINKIREDNSRSPKTIFGSSIGFFWGSILSIIFLFIVILFAFSKVDLMHSLWDSLSDFYFVFINIVFLLLSLMFAVFAIRICTPVKPDIMMGYLNEKDDISTTHSLNQKNL